MPRKLAIITGGARGIGRGCAHALAEKGLNIALVDLLPAEMERTKAELQAMGATVTCHEADVSQFTRAAAVIAEIMAAHGRIDVLVNNAGRGNPKGITEITEDEFDRTIAVTLKSCFNYIHAGGGGRIVSMSSLNAFSGGVTSAVSKFSYATAKAGILGMTRALAKELGPSIAINAICPGVIETELGNSLTKARGPELMKGIALGRLGTPQDVAQLVAFLATVEPNFITGQSFVIDGFQWMC